MFWKRLLCIAAKVSILYQGSTGVFVRKWPTCLLPRRIQIQASLPYTWSGAYPMYRYIGYFLFWVFILSFHFEFLFGFISNIFQHCTEWDNCNWNIRLMHQILLLDTRWCRLCTVSCFETKIQKLEDWKRRETFWTSCTNQKRDFILYLFFYVITLMAYPGKLAVNVEGLYCFFLVANIL